MIKTVNQPDALLRWMGSLADGTRLRILRLLERHELGVVELCDVLQMPQSTVSRHLKLLADERWVESRRQGTTNFYRMILDELDEPARRLWLLARGQTDRWATLHQDQVRLARRLRQRRAESQAFFAGAAGEWDRLREELYGTSFGRDAAMALLPSTWTVADLGCGTGLQAADLARFVAKVIAVDNSDAMLAAARARTRDLPHVEVREGDLEALPIEDGTCDAAVCVLVLTYLPEPAAAVREMRRVLKPGGRAVVVDLLRHDREDFRRRMGQQSLGFERQGLCDMLEEAGFTEAQCRELPPEMETSGPALLLATGEVSFSVSS